jgi:hypothetical protein
MITNVLLIALLLVTVTAVPLDRYKGVSRSRSIMSAPKTQKTLKLVGEYIKNKLEDVSPDGELLLFYQTSSPMRTYTIPLDGRQGRANQPETYDDVLRVVERASGRELKRITVEFFPEDVQFIPGTQQVFFKEPKKSGSKLEWRLKIWNSMGKANTCSDDDAVHSGYITFLNDQHALYADWQETSREHLLGTLTLPDCKRTIIGPVNPSQTKVISGRLLGSEGFSLSPGRDQVAYETREEVVFVRDTATLKTVKEIHPSSGLIFGRNPLYTPDGKFLLVVASNTIFDKPETRRYLLFYDTKNYEIARQLDITSWSPPVLRDDVAVNSNALGTAMAVSPDSRLLAVGYTKEERKGFSTTEQAQIALYDLTTGEEVARASHPPVKQQRDDPFIAKVGKLGFTPDGKYLLSSTYDTLVWQIENRGN